MSNQQTENFLEQVMEFKAEDQNWNDKFNRWILGEITWQQLWQGKERPKVKRPNNW